MPAVGTIHSLFKEMKKQSLNSNIKVFFRLEFMK